MSKLQNIAILITALIGLNASAQSNRPQSFIAQNIASTTNCVIPKVEGETLPFPLRMANTKFELSENQTYLLNGTLVQIQGQILFKVDFYSQPWLATEKLMQFPYFPVDAVTAKQANHYVGQLIQIAVVARKNDQDSSGNESANSEIRLSIILNPVNL